MKLLVVQIAAFGWDLLQEHADAFASLGISFRPMRPPFPAVTCTAQAVMRTALPPAETGVVCNGRFDRLTRKTDFWNQSARLVRGPRIWDGARRRGSRIGMLFWQQSLGENIELLLSPAPIHKHHGGMIQDCYSKPAPLYAACRKALRRPFNLMRYWGPMASLASSRWITDATIQVLQSATVDILFSYLPHLDYALQKHGPQNEKKTRAAVQELVPLLADLIHAAREADADVVFWGDYAITPAEHPVFPNLALRQADLFRVRHVRGMTYPDLYESPALAMVDHQIAHVYVQAASHMQAVRQCLAGLDGVASVTPGPTDAAGEGGDLVLTAAPGAWFAYPWWTDSREAPDYASHVDIHNKIGFDPGELFWGWPPPGISQDAARVRGTHGRDDAPVAFGGTLLQEADIDSLPALARHLRRLLDHA